MVAAAVAADKKQLLDGKPTSINQNDYSNLSDAELTQQIADNERLAEQSSGADANADTKKGR